MDEVVKKQLALADLSARIRLAVWPMLRDRPELDELVEPAAEMAVIRIGLERDKTQVVQDAGLPDYRRMQG